MLVVISLWVLTDFKYQNKINLKNAREIILKDNSYLNKNL